MTAQVCRTSFSDELFPVAFPRFRLVHRTSNPRLFDGGDSEPTHSHAAEEEANKYLNIGHMKEISDDETGAFARPRCSEARQQD